MKLKEVGNLMSPPSWRGYSQRRRERRQKPLWDGVYEHYRDVPCSGRGFDDDFWVDETRSMTESLLALDSIREFPASVIEDHLLLPPTVASLKTKGRVASILDFGGGMGVSYITLRHCLPRELALRYKIVECPRVCQSGSELFVGDQDITFCESLPGKTESIDLVYVCSSLQYVEDYAGLLRSLTEYRPQAILLAKTTAGDMSTYATAQINVPGSSFPYWILNVNEVEQIMASAGYSLSCRSVLPRVYYQGNFPEQYRFGLTQNLLFLPQCDVNVEEEKARLSIDGSNH